MSAHIKTASDKVIKQNATRRRLIGRGSTTVTPKRSNPLTRVVDKVKDMGVIKQFNKMSNNTTIEPKLDKFTLAIREVIKARALLARINEIMLEEGLSGNSIDWATKAKLRYSSVKEKFHASVAKDKEEGASKPRADDEIEDEYIRERDKLIKILELWNRKKKYTNELKSAIENARQEALKEFGPNYTSSEIYKSKLVEFKIVELSTIEKLDRNIAEANSVLANIDMKEAKEVAARARAAAEIDAKIAVELEEINAELEEINEAAEKAASEKAAADKAVELAASDKAAAEKAEAAKAEANKVEAAKLEAAKSAQSARLVDTMGKGDNGVGVFLSAPLKDDTAEAAGPKIADPDPDPHGPLDTDPAPSAAAAALAGSKLYAHISPSLPSLDENAPIEPKQASSNTTIDNTKQALLQSIELCIAVQKSNGKDEGHTIDSKIIVAINATINSENYIFSKNTLKKAIEAISSITKNNVTYSRDVSRMDMVRFITETKTAVETAGTEAKSVLGEDEKLQALVTSIVKILPYYKIDKKNAFSIIAIFTILAAKGHVNFASSIPLTIPALNSFMAALNAYEASLELEAINENLNKQTEGTEDDAFMTGGTWAQNKEAMARGLKSVGVATARGLKSIGTATARGAVAASENWDAIVEPAWHAMAKKKAEQAAQEAAIKVKEAETNKSSAFADAALKVAQEEKGIADQLVIEKNKAIEDAKKNLQELIDKYDLPKEKEAILKAAFKMEQDEAEKTTDVVEEDDKAPSQTDADIIPLQIAQVKAAKNLARKLEHYFNMCVVLETEANSSENEELSNKAKALRINAYKYYKEAEKAANENEINKTLALGEANEVNTSLRILTRDRLNQLKSDREKIDNYVKDIQKSQNKTTIEDKIKQLIVHLNSLLDNKRVLYDSANTTAELNNSKAKEEQAYIESINKIMNYLNEKNIDLKYYWIEIVNTKDDKDKLLGKLGIIKELNGIKEIPDTDADVAGLWYFDLWIPDDGGTPILSPPGAVSKYMKVITKDKKTFNSFVKTITPSIYSIRFLVDIDENPIKYDPYLPNNILPDVTRANMTRIDKKKRWSEWSSASGIARGSINKTSAFGSGVNKHTLGLGEFKSKYKIEIEKILDHEIDNEDQKKLLKTVIVYSNKKLSIRDILATNISSIFAKGETSLNVFRQQNLKKNFEKKKPDPEDEEEEEEEEEDGEKAVKPDANIQEQVTVGQPIFEYKVPTVKGIKEGGALQEEEEEEGEGEDEQTGGLGGYGFRNFDRDDASKFITFILTSLLELKTINSDSKNKLNNNQALLFEKYLRTLFGKVGPKTLNGLLPQIDNAIAVSGLVIKHFKIRLTKDNEGKQKPKDEGEGKGKGVGVGEEAEEAEEGEEAVKDEDTPAKQISQLNFSLKHNVGPFVAAIIDITLNTQELKGSEGEIEKYLDRKFDLAMKKPQDQEQTRISNSELRDVFKSIFGPNMSTINIYRERITKMDELIDAINDKNINNKIKEINHLLVFAEISKGVITYKMPDKIKAKLEEQPTDETTEEKLKRALALIAELKDAENIDTIKAKAREQQFI
jgi:hypothetical protein